MKQYRFKTKEELFSEYGLSWRICFRDNYRFSFIMDYLLGQEVSQFLSEDDKLRLQMNQLPQVFTANINGSSWTVSKEFITEMNIVPTYEPRKLIRE